MQNKREKNTSQAFAEFEHTKNSAKISQAIKKGVFNNFQSFCQNVSTCGVVVQGALGRESSAPPPSLKTIFDKVKSDNNQLLL